MLDTTALKVEIGWWNVGIRQTISMGKNNLKRGLSSATPHKEKKKNYTNERVMLTNGG